MTTCDVCGNWFDWSNTRFSDVFDEAMPLVKQMGYRYACKNCMEDILETHKERAVIYQPYDGVSYYEL
jgi:hypothetical protein